MSESCRDVFTFGVALCIVARLVIFHVATQDCLRSEDSKGSLPPTLIKSRAGAYVSVLGIGSCDGNFSFPLGCRIACEANSGPQEKRDERILCGAVMLVRRVSHV